MRLLKVLVQSAREAMMAWLEQPLFLLLSVILDALFVVLYGFITQPFKDKIIDHVIVITAAAAKDAPGIITSSLRHGTNIFSLIFQQPGTQGYAWRLACLAVLLSLAAYASYVIVHSVIWYLANRMSGSRQKLVDFIARFAIINIWLGIAAALYSTLSLLISLQDAAAGVENSMITKAMSGIGVAAYFWLFWWIYGRCIQRCTIIGGIRSIAKNFLPSVSVAAVLLVLLFVIDRLIVALLGAGRMFALIVGGALLFIALAWGRVFVCKVVQHVDPQP